MTRIILTDIEGTTSSIHFVKEVLFPYAAEHLAGYVQQHQNDEAVQEILFETARLASVEGDAFDPRDTEGLIAHLLQWIAEDRKVTPLKSLQGLIWEAGYRNGDYQAHMYPDATEYLQAWHEQGLPLYVYSSGSVKAQELFFEFTQDGNLLPLFNGHFDTLIGGKRETGSYVNILGELQKQHAGLAAGDVLFLSDIKEELDAAKQAGMRTCWLVREGDLPAESEHPVVKTFAEIELGQ